MTNPIAPGGPARAAHDRIVWRWRWAVAFLVGFLLVTVASLHAQEAQHAEHPLVLWSEPPTIGSDSNDVEVVHDELPAIASADWPEFTDSVTTELAKCTGLRPPHDWHVRTVAAQALSVRIWYGERWVEGQPFIGYTFPSVHRIYVVQAGLRSRGLLRHELLHAILADNGLPAGHGTPLADALFPRCAPDIR